MAKKKTNNDSKSIKSQVVAAMQEKKGKDIISLDFGKIPDAVTKYFVICHVSSRTQARAIFDYVVEKVKLNSEISPYHREGYENSEWLLIDYVDVVAHVFIEETRHFYNLEGLWADTKKESYESEA
ncbi:MAG: ribosome silencing factor [Bacteroidales bacterium]|nr:ribosome silencing factor [Bacteroidales bacterium]